MQNIVSLNISKLFAPKIKNPRVYKNEVKKVR